MLAKVTRPDGNAVTFAYDALGRRVSKTYRGQTTRWIWDGNVPLHEWVEGKLLPLAEAGGVPFVTDGAEANKREAELEDQLAQGPPLRGYRQAPLTWLFEPESFAPMARICGGQHHAIVCDHLGTPVLLVNDEGRPAWRASISAYGELRDLSGERWACPFRWPGQYEDLETGLYYNRFRYYDPQAGQYTSQDPIRLAGGPRPYGYVRDPNRWIDPRGLSGCGRTHASIETPYGPAEQSLDPAALAARQHVERGATLYRTGTMGRSEADAPQFWALEHPHNAGYSARHGIPPENVERADFIEAATLKPGTPFVTRPAPAVGTNPGGGIEVVVPKGGAQLQSFNTKGAAW